MEGNKVIPDRTGAHRILVISLAGVGDTLICTPLIRELRAHFPASTIDAFVLWPASRDLLLGNTNLNEVFQINLLKTPKLECLKFLSSLRARHYDISINSHPQSRTGYRIIARLIGAPIRLSHIYDRSSILDPLLVTHRLPQDYTTHSVENNFRLLQLLGPTPLLSAHALEVFLDSAEVAWARQFAQASQLTGKKVVGLHVGSGTTKNLALKRWPLANYQQLIKRGLAEDPRTLFLLFGGPEERQDHQRILDLNGSSRVLAPETRNLRQAAALLGECSAFVSVDTALMHLAAAMRVPNQIVIEAPTLNKTNEPYGNPFFLVRNPAIQGRHLEFYRYDGRGIQGTREELLRCMASVTVDAVWQTLRTRLG